MKKDSYTLALIDDQPDELVVIKEYIHRLPFLEPVLEAADPVHAMLRLERLRPDLLLLDIEMPKFSGFQLLGMLSYSPSVVICSGHPSYAYEASSAEVSGYISKIESFERFEQVIRRAIQHWDNIHLPDEVPRLLQVAALKGRNFKIAIPVDSLIRIEINEKETLFVGRKFERSGRISLNELEAILPRGRFIRVHRSHIINLAYVKSFSQGVVLLEGKDDDSGDQRVPIGRKYVVEFITRMEQSSGFR